MNTREGGLSSGESGEEDSAAGFEVVPGLELEDDKEDGEEEDSALTAEEAVRFINELAQNGQTETLLNIKDNFIECKVCSEDEFDELVVLATTKRIRRYIDIAQEIESQIEEINRVLGPDCAGSNHNQEVVRDYYQRAAELDLERAKIIRGREWRHDTHTKQLLKELGNGLNLTPEE